jgi:hypothetical protein
MKNPFSSRGKAPRTVILDGTGQHATSRPSPRHPQPRVDPPQFAPMRIKRLSSMRTTGPGLVIDMEPAATAIPPAVIPSQPEDRLILASQARLAARVQRLRESVADLRLEIEALRR